MFFHVDSNTETPRTLEARSKKKFSESLLWGRQLQILEGNIPYKHQAPVELTAACTDKISVLTSTRIN